MSKPNILFIENSLLPSRGGIEKVTDILSQALSKEGYKCFYAYKYVDNPQYPSESKILLDFNLGQNDFLRRFEQFVRENKIRIIINQGLSQRRILNSLAHFKRQQIKIINCLHNTPQYLYHIQPPKDIRNKLILLAKSILMRGNVYVREQQKLYEICDYFVLLSTTFVTQAQSVFHLRETKKCIAIPNPLVFSSSTFCSNKDKTVLIVARFDENQKNIKSALRIWKQVSEVMTDWKLTIIGYGDAKQDYLDYIQKFGIKSVYIEGKKENPVEYYCKAAIFMMTSNYEGFCMTLIEALQNQCIPFVFDTFTSVHDIIIDGKNGYIIPPFDEKLYAQKMITLMGSSQLMEQFRKQSHSSIEKFEIKNILNEWYKILN